MKDQDLKNVLSEIYQENGGKITPELVLERAKSKQSPIHHRFEWDDSVAGSLYRIEQARSIIQSVKVEMPTQQGTTVTVRAYVSLPSDRANNGGYKHVSEVISSRQMREELATDMAKTAREWQQRALVFGVKLNTQTINELANELKGS